MNNIALDRSLIVKLYIIPPPPPSVLYISNRAQTSLQWEGTVSGTEDLTIGEGLEVVLGKQVRSQFQHLIRTLPWPKACIFAQIKQQEIASLFITGIKFFFVFFSPHTLLNNVFNLLTAVT